MEDKWILVWNGEIVFYVNNIDIAMMKKGAKGGGKEDVVREGR